MLEVRRLSVSYGGLRAVDEVSLEVRPGEIVSIIGANGAGKTSILNAISGIVSPEKGEILFEGESIGGLPAHAVIARGIVQVPEGRMIFGTLSVEENLRVAAHQSDRFVLRRHSRSGLQRLFPALADKLDRPAAGLSGGEAQMLALARGLESGPRLLLLDEPSLGLSPKLAEEVFGLIRRLRDQGLTILLVEQNVRKTLALADRAYVLESGRITLQGSAAELKSDERLVSNYLGLSAPESLNPDG
ncbi:MAG: ABC transporter ATP-binding protein [Alphaproteobacteria bacterium]|nr:ABC transporter ATP-binding protein [Alphaproteobacteria bacterium]